MQNMQKAGRYVADRSGHVALVTMGFAAAALLAWYVPARLALAIKPDRHTTR